MITISKDTNTISYSDKYVICTKNAKYSRERDMPRGTRRLKFSLRNLSFTTSTNESSFTIYFKNGLIARSKVSYQNENKAKLALSRYLNYIANNTYNTCQVKTI